MPMKFTYICDLLERLETLEVRDIPLLPLDKKQRYHATIENWFRNHRRLIDAHDTDRVALLSTLLPERRTDRVYGLREPSLVKILGRCLGLGRDRLQVLDKWKSSDPEDLASLISHIQRITDAALLSHSVTIEIVDTVLTKLASRSRFSSPHVRNTSSGNPRRRTYVLGNTKEIPENLLGPVLVGLSSRDLKWFIRLILKRFHPVTIDEHAILKNVHPFLPRILRFQSTFDAAIQILKDSTAVDLTSNVNTTTRADLASFNTASYLRPQIGVKVGRPEFVKARSIKHCLTLASGRRWAIEPKYDGEYCQLHVDISKGSNCIQIFSKSGKDSTKDRRSMHNWIKWCLKIGQPDCLIRKRCILEGEMVVFSDKDDAILDFHKIRKHVSRSGSYFGTEADSPRHNHEHLMIVFFDALLIDDDVIMAQPYEIRRRKLREIMHYYPGWCQTADWGTIDFGKVSTGKAVRKLDRAFAKAIARRCEGLMLKPCDQPYFSLNDNPGPGKFIKLKKDYIPGLGDTADFAIVGASYNAVEVPPDARSVKWTHFTIACLENKAQVCRYQERPVFRVLGVLSRPCISIPDLLYLSTQGQVMFEPYDGQSMPTNYDLLHDNYDQSVEVVFKRPFIVEVLGASFEKPPSRNFYMLRHPRMLKVYRERGYEDVVSFDELQDMARTARALPEDAVRDEEEWLKRIQKTHRARDMDSVSTISQTTTTSPGSKRTSPSKSPNKSQAIPLIRMDSLELLPRETNTSPPSMIRRAKPLAKTTMTMLLTPPTSSLVPISSRTISESALLRPSSRPLKRKRDTKEVLIAEVEQSKARKIQTVAAKMPLAEIMNSPAKCHLSSRNGSTSLGHEAMETRKIVRFSPSLQNTGFSAVQQLLIPSAAATYDLAAQNRLGKDSGLTRHNSINYGTTTRHKSCSSKSERQELLDSLSQASNSHEREKIITAATSYGVDVPGKDVEMTLSKIFTSLRHTTQQQQSLAMELELHGSRRINGFLLDPNVASRTKDKGNTCLVGERLPVNLASKPSTRLHNTTIHDSATFPEARLRTIPTQHAPQPVLFTRCTLYLSPCIATVPYLLQNLLPKVIDAATPTSDNACLINASRINTSLSYWTRDIQEFPPDSAVVSESQAYEGLQKAVLVESRRGPQTKAVIDRIVNEIKLISDETVDIWDWRAIEDAVENIGAPFSPHKTMNIGGSGMETKKVGMRTCSTSQDKMQRMILAAVEQAELEDVANRMIETVQKWYLGWVSWSEVSKCNVWRKATQAEKAEKAAKTLSWRHLH